jgi:hypothetical protein
MLNLDNGYGKNFSLRLAYENMSKNDVIHAQHLYQFRKKRIDLAWTLLHIMREVHKVEEPVLVRVMIRIVKILLYLIFQSPKPIS